MHSLQTRLFLAILLVTAAAAIALGLFSTRTTEEQFQLLQRRPGAALQSAPRIAPALASWYALHGTWSGVQGALRESGPNLVLFSSAGRYIAASFPGVVRASIERGENETIRIAVAQGRFYGEHEIVISNLPATPLRDRARHIVGRLYAVPVPTGSRASDNPVQSLGRKLWLAVALVILAALVAAIALARNILAPVCALSEAARAMQQGDLSRRVAAGGPSEIAALATQFNDMAAHLDRSETLRKRMVADIAHELRTPLTNIRGMLEAMQDGHIAASAETLGSLSDEALILERLVNDLQDMSLADAGQMTLHCESISLSDTVQSVAAGLAASAAGKHIRLRVTPSGDDTVHADESRVRQIVANIVSNAIRLSPERSEITMRVEAHASGVSVTICDEGPGLSQDALQNAFERFYRADESRSRHSGGAGLGLAIAKQLAQAHGGSISAVNNSPAPGASFTLMLPRGAC